MPGDVAPFKTGERPHPDVVKLREQKRIDEMAPTDCELRVIDSFLCNLESRGTGAQKAIAASPVEFGLEFLRPRNEQRQMHTKQIVAFDHVRIAFLDKCGESLERVSFRFLNIVWIDNNQFFPAAVVRESDAHDMIVSAGIGDPGAGVTDSGYSIKQKHFELDSF